MALGSGTEAGGRGDNSWGAALPELGFCQAVGKLLARVAGTEVATVGCHGDPALQLPPLTRGHRGCHLLQHVTRVSDTVGRKAMSERTQTPGSATAGMNLTPRMPTADDTHWDRTSLPCRGGTQQQSHTLRGRQKSWGQLHCNRFLSPPPRGCKDGTTARQWSPRGSGSALLSGPAERPAARTSCAGEGLR